ncbi:MAG: polymer-forming cytoskeletal protein [Rhodospirillales bacterium]|nr:polymer-forming cytoskeletal protein [Rhodospirillales bacterium]
MFRRKKDDSEDHKIVAAGDDLPPADSALAGPKPFPRPVLPPMPTALGGGPITRSPAPGALAPRSPAGGRDRPTDESEGKKLIVGREICLSGQITSCERLIVEGQVEAALSESRLVEIAETGFFKGTAEIETAEIAGRFEGSITVRERLFIRSTGRVHGTIRYGQIEIEPGGEISGDVQVVSGRSQPSLKAVAEPGGDGHHASLSRDSG